MIRIVILALFFTSILFLSNSFAQTSTTTSTTEDATTVTTTFANKIVEVAEGPVTKFLAAIILLAGVGGLLRGSHRLAVSCAVAFIVLLCLPLLIPH